MHAEERARFCRQSPGKTLQHEGNLAANPTVHYHNCRPLIPPLTPRNLRWLHRLPLDVVVRGSSGIRAGYFVKTPAFRPNRTLLQAVLSSLNF